MKTMSLIVGIVLSLSGLAYAAPGEEALDWATDDYEAIPFTTVDVATLGAIALTYGFLNNQMFQVIPVSAFMGWGAWRTNKYRSEVNRAQVATNLRKAAALPTPGTIRHSLECDGTNC